MKQCSTCGAEAAGNFCASCGASLARVTCPSCATPSAPGARFCTGCGAGLGQGGPTPVAGGAGAPAAGHASGHAGPGVPTGQGRGPQGSAMIAWAIAGLLLVGFIVVIATPVLSPSGSTARPAAQGGSLGPAPHIDINAMTPREAADSLFQRVMRGVSAQDTTEILNFLPMALAAYDRARPLDADGHFHLSLLHRAGLDYPSALTEAQAGLELYPDHILNLSAAAEASIELGDSAAAHAYFTRLLEVYDVESRLELEDYQAHADLLPVMRREARAFLGEP